MDVCANVGRRVIESATFDLAALPRCGHHVGFTFFIDFAAPQCEVRLHCPAGASATITGVEIVAQRGTRFYEVLALADLARIGSALAALDTRVDRLERANTPSNGSGAELTAAPEPQIYRGYCATDLEVFAPFDIHPPPTPGFITDFHGARARCSLLWDGLDALSGTTLPLPVPGDYHSEAIEWIGTLRSVLAARDGFTAMEVGAGMGTWLVASGVRRACVGCRHSPYRHRGGSSGLCRSGTLA